MAPFCYYSFSGYSLWRLFLWNYQLTEKFQLASLNNVWKCVWFDAFSVVMYGRTHISQERRIASVFSTLFFVVFWLLLYYLHYWFMTRIPKYAYFWSNFWIRFGFIISWISYLVSRVSHTKSCDALCTSVCVELFFKLNSADILDSLKLCITCSKWILCEHYHCKMINKHKFMEIRKQISNFVF